MFSQDTLYQDAIDCDPYNVTQEKLADIMFKFPAHFGKLRGDAGDVWDKANKIALNMIEDKSHPYWPAAIHLLSIHKPYFNE